MGRVTVSEKITSVRIRDGKLYHSQKPDSVAAEEPLDIRLNGQALSLTMRTPGNDLELIHGFLHAEGYLRGKDEIFEARYCDGAVVDDGSGFERNTYNVMDVSTRNLPLLQPIIKPFTTNSACGVCGSSSIDAVQGKVRFEFPSKFRLTPHQLLFAQQQLAISQGTFAKTGGVHAAALFDQSGKMLVLREDVGRHNAVDKVVGWALLNDQLSQKQGLDQAFLLVSSRASFEIVQKAAMAGITLIACVSAPSSLAIETAQRFGITLIGFLRSTTEANGKKRINSSNADSDSTNTKFDGRFNIYSCPERINLEESLS